MIITITIIIVIVITIIVIMIPDNANQNCLLSNSNAANHAASSFSTAKHWPNLSLKTLLLLLLLSLLRSDDDDDDDNWSKYGWTMVVRNPETVWHVSTPLLLRRGKLPDTNSTLSGFILMIIIVIMTMVIIIIMIVIMIVIMIT